jgi:FecR protein
MGISSLSRTIVLSLAVSVGVFGATPIARVISADTVDVSGIAAPARNFAVVAVGDEVTTKGTPATLQFRDGTSITLHQNSRLRVEGPAGQPTVRMVKGTAAYRLAPASNLRIVNTRGELLNQILDNGLSTGMSRGNPLTDPMSAGLIYRSPAGKQTGVAVPSGSITVGQFSSNVIQGTGFNGPQIKLPSGIVINLTATTTTPAGGGPPVVTYTVASVSVPVTITDTASNGTVTTTALPNTYATISSGTATGQSAAVTSAIQQLLGAQVGGVSSTSTGSSVALTLTTSTGTALTAAQVQTDLNAAAPAAVTNAVNTGAVTLPTPPAGSTQTSAPVVQSSPVESATYFSSSAS